MLRVTRTSSKQPPVAQPPLPPASGPSSDVFHRIERQLKSDPAFQQITVDGLSWIDPFTGLTIPAPFGYLEPAREYLVTKQPWKTIKPKSLDELGRLRWVIHLRTYGNDEERLKILGKDGRWMNPYTGKWVTLPKGTRAHFVDVLAEVLATCPEAQTNRLLEPRRLDQLTRANRDDSGPAEIVGDFDSRVSEPSKTATQRISGHRSSETNLMPVATVAPGGDDLDRAKRIIDKMMPEPPELPGYGAMVHYEPHSKVGGDFYDFITLADGTHLIVVGDVSGHGVQGALVVVAALKALRYISRGRSDLRGILSAFNDEVRKDLVSGQFITLFAAVLDAEAHALTVVCAGHGCALVANRKKRAVLETLGTPGPAIGLVGGDTFARALKPVQVDLAPGDVVFVYTDGLNEARDQKAQEFGLFRVMGAVVAHLDQPYDGLVHAVISDVKAFCADNIDDDLTVLALARDA